MSGVNKIHSPCPAFDIVVATDKDGGIARNNEIPWNGTPIGKQDQIEFKRRTMGGCVIMGRKTYDAIPAKFRPLSGRINYVISRSVDHLVCMGALTESPVYYAHSLATALNHAAQQYPDRRRYVIGGADIYNIALKMCVDTIYQTIIPQSAREIAKGNLNYNCDRFFRPPADKTDKQIITNRFNDLSIDTHVYKINKSERAYLELMREIIDQPLAINRTDTKTHRVFSRTLKFPLSAESDGQSYPILPVLTTKTVYSRMVINELLWFIRGETDTKFLVANKTPIWDGNTTREALDGRGLTNYEVGETGPIYGYQWRRWNLDYDLYKLNKATGLGKCNVSPTERATQTDMYDQLSDVVARIKKSPYDRRLLVSAWNPEQIDQMALPPCHYAFQFYCDDQLTTAGVIIPRISIQVNMRSADMGLGVPFNIMSYGLLLHMVAHLTGRVAHELSLVMTDCHVYANHIDAIREQITRTPLAYPRFSFSPKMIACKTWDEIGECTLTDFIIEPFDKHPPLKMEMVV